MNILLRLDIVAHEDISFYIINTGSPCRFDENFTCDFFLLVHGAFVSVESKMYFHLKRSSNCWEMGTWGMKGVRRRGWLGEGCMCWDAAVVGYTDGPQLLFLVLRVQDTCHVHIDYVLCYFCLILWI